MKKVNDLLHIRHHPFGAVLYFGKVLTFDMPTYYIISYSISFVLALSMNNGDGFTILMQINRWNHIIFHTLRMTYCM